MAAQPDVLVSAAGEVVALRGGDGRLSVLKSGNNDALAVGDWLNADGDARPAADRALAQGFACDPDGCVGRLADGAIVAVARSPGALPDDCSRAAVLVTPRPPPPGCAAMVIDRRALRGTGAVALFRRDGNFEVVAARPDGLDRPWARRYGPGEMRPARGSAVRPEPDATPPSEADAVE
jgi:competence protein ComEC